MMGGLGTYRMVSCYCKTGKEKTSDEFKEDNSKNGHIKE